MQSHNDNWLRHFQAAGYAEVEPLAAGMEGAVYRLRRGLVAKVWGDKSQSELARLQRFYADIAQSSLPFATPEILEIHDVDNTAVTFEVELQGRPMQEFLSEDDGSAPNWATVCLSTVLRGLATVPESPSALDLPVLGMSGPFRGGQNWCEALLSLLRGREAVFGGQLRAAVPNFDSIFASLIASIEKLPSVANRVIHGDICGVNILVSSDMVPTAVLDWGFLSTAGDPSFDAGVAAGIVNMYGVHAEAIEQQLLAHFETDLGYPIDRLRIYRAAYAVATSNAYDERGLDGHFAWCTRTLRRDDINTALNRGSS